MAIDLYKQGQNKKIYNPLLLYKNSKGLFFYIYKNKKEEKGWRQKEN
jgi:hypothetical protein